MVVVGGKCIPALENLSIKNCTTSQKQKLRKIILVNATLPPAQQDFAVVRT